MLKNKYILKTEQFQVMLRTILSYQVCFISKLHITLNFKQMYTSVNGLTDLHSQLFQTNR